MTKLSDYDLENLDDSDLTDADFPELKDQQEGEFASDPTRFTDGAFEKVAWDHGLALRQARVDPNWPRAQQVATLQDAVNEGRLPDEAVERLIDAGYTELGE